MVSTLPKARPGAGDRTEESPGFPLPLSDFEHYMLVEDSRSHPMVITMVAHVEGRLNRSALEDSLLEAIGFHPLLGAQVAKVRKLGECWVAAASRPPVFMDSEYSQMPLELPWIDLRNESGLRVHVYPGGEGARIVFFFHHACVDGIAAVQFIGDVLARYARRTTAETEDAPELPRFDPALMRQRTDVRSPDGARLGFWPGLREAFHFLVRRVSPLAASGEAAEHRIAIRTRVLDRDVSRGLNAAAAQAGVTVNDLCTLLMARTIVAWNDAVRGPGRDKRFRILIPLSMRTIIHDNVPAANIVSYLPMNFHRSEPASGAEFARRVHRRTAWSLETRYGSLFLQGLRVCRMVPGLLRAVVSGRNYYTAILANVGDVRRLLPCAFPQKRGRIIAGDVTVSRIDGVAPVRPNTRLAVSFGRYAGQLIFNMRTDATALSDEASEDLFDQFVERVRQLAADRAL